MATQRRGRSTTAANSLADISTTLGPFIAAANVIMQLATAPVGYGVVESRVTSGRVLDHPIKRARTTATYLAVALLGTAEEQAILRSEIQRIHTDVHSTAESPVRYSGNDPRLQLWVGVCLARFFTDQHELLYGPMTPQLRARLHADAARLATTLNVKPEQWPATPEGLDEYFRRGIAEIRIDPPVRRYLQNLADLSFLGHRFGILGKAVHRLGGRLSVFFTRAALPPEFRAQMGWAWTESDQARFDQAAKLFRLADRIVPAAYKKMLTVNLWEMRLRRRLGVRVF